jgi:hypothetical protein
VHLEPYEVGVLEVLCNKLHEEDKENKREDRLLFDIVAETSTGVTNGAILVSICKVTFPDFHFCCCCAQS